ncbi:hypothetical protein IMSHALPRED_010210 [Imshaugia aleurites]|uniref:Major facilitator superfamily (MFS) profile domain-containing protein n=1 Tax=Imshaugia aleurites TaxID=172621 RepID=A0A8H3G377_9LECA|nr:hypothetical protein IMSHALPRED_010210 [Imshaugia aleurites]
MPERMENPVEGSVEVRGSLAPDYIEHKQDVSIGQARRRAIAILIVFTNLVPMISWGLGIGGGLIIGKSLGVDGPSQAAWIPASYSLTSGAFVLMAGRLGSVYGHKKILLGGAAWWILGSFVNAFCNNFMAFNIVRALSGIGAAMIVPNAIAIIGTTLPPGKMRNLSLGFFGAGAPVGGWLGALFSGLLAELTPWKWLFIFMALLGLIVFGSLALVLPPEDPISKSEPMDWFGSMLGISGLIIFNFVWNQAPTAGWNSPYEIALLILAIIFFATFAIWEHKYAPHPILPLSIFKAPSFLPLVIVVLFSFMSYATFIWYLVAWQQEIRHWSALSTAIGLSPIAICAAAAAFIAAWLIPRLAAQWILAIGALAVLVAQLILATMPAQQTYWPSVFPATVVQSFCPDFIFTAAAIIASNSVKRHEQGIAGSLIGTLQLYATSIGLGFAGVLEVHLGGAGGESEIVRGYRGALYFGIGLATVALVICALWVRMPRDTREGWQGDDRIPHSRRDKNGDDSPGLSV